MSDAEDFAPKPGPNKTTDVVGAIRAQKEKERLDELAAKAAKIKKWGKDHPVLEDFIWNINPKDKK